MDEQLEEELAIPQKIKTTDNVNGSATSGSNATYWLESTQPLSSQILNKGLKTDVVIVGGGIAGLSVAYNLVKAGKKVVVVEDGNIGSGETGRTTAHLVNALDDRYYDLERMFGKDKTKLVASSHTEAINFIENIIAIENIECEFKRVDGYLFLHPSDEPSTLDKELKACNEAGLQVEISDEVPGLNDSTGPCLKFPDQAKFHPMKYLEGLYKAIIEKGGLVFTNTHAEIIDHTGIVTRDGHEVKADHVVIATNSPVNNKYIPHLQQYAYRTYVIGARVKKDTLPDVLWWDTGDVNANAEIPPYHYVRLQPLDDQYDLLISGGEDHGTGLADAEHITEGERYALLEKWTRAHFEIEDIIYQWSGQVLEPMDSLAYIGRNPTDHKNVYIVTGDSGNGMTHATIAGILIKDLIVGNENEWADLYDPSRFKLFTAGKTFFKEVAQGLISYIKTKPHPEDNEMESIPADEGKIVKMDGKPYGVYRDEANQLHIVEAECTHMKCIIKWNGDEKSWDCPCHGSRFTYEGQVINGPANRNLLYHKEDKVLVNR
ncbi:MAG: Gamma-glutamylputrescine oxidoreductase [Cytophagaceae bacterium]|jgi:glycine/D-amino acid oxidase-like deaminating enzyme/nitrite reductase/ring-hydroxylating ferredoxin subunit|nr:Gamma-glutamylputrescine oxidoreductase [Cytophagaceae bacterium]